MTSAKVNFLYNAAYQAMTLILPLATAPYLSRVLGAEGLGVCSYTYSIAYYFVLFALLGVNSYGNRSIAAVRDDPERLSRTFCGIYALQLTLAVAAFALYCGYVALFAEFRAASIAWGLYVLSAGLDVNWLFFGLERFKVTVTRNFIVKLSTFCLMFVVVRGENALMAYLILMSTSMLVSVGVLWPFVRRSVAFVRPTASEVLAHLKPNLVLFIPVVATSLYTVMDKVMLGSMSTMEQSGFFENSVKVAGMPFTLIEALGTVMLPRASNLFATGHRDQVVRTMATSTWFALWLSAGLMFGLMAVASEFAPVFFGPGYEPCALIMAIIVADMPFLAWANVVRTQWLIPARHDRAYAVAVICGAAINIVLNVVLIPPYGAVGAAISLLVAEATVSIVQTLFVVRELPVLAWLRGGISSCVIGALMFVAVRACSGVLPGGWVGLVLEILMGVAVFAVLSAVWFRLSGNAYARDLFGSARGMLAGKLAGLRRR